MDSMNHFRPLAASLGHDSTLLGAGQHQFHPEELPASDIERAKNMDV